MEEVGNISSDQVQPIVDCCRQFSDFFPPGLATLHFCDHVFRTLDTDGSGFLDFKEVAVTVQSY